MSFDYQPTLKADLLELRPLCREDFDDLYAVAADPLVWEQHPVNNRHEEVIFQGFFREALASGGALIARDAKTQRVIGSSRFHGYDREDSEVEIGWTFFGQNPLGRGLQWTDEATHVATCLRFCELRRISGGSHEPTLATGHGEDRRCSRGIEDGRDRPRQLCLPNYRSDICTIMTRRREGLAQEGDPT